MMRQFSNKTSKITLIALIVALILSIVAIIIYVISPTRELDKYADLEFTLEETIDQILDIHVTNILISEYQIRNDGMHPSVQYLTETMSPIYPLFSEDISMRGGADDPTSSAWPQAKEIHIWLDYTCVSELRDYVASKNNYEELIRQDAGTYAIVYLSTTDSTGLALELGQGAEYVYRCATSAQTAEDSSVLSEN